MSFKYLLTDINGTILTFFKPYPKVSDTLNALKSKGNKIYAVTSDPNVIAKNKLKAAGLDVFFDGVFSASDFNTYKSREDVYALVAKEIGAKVEECLIIGDSERNDIKHPNKSGFTTVKIVHNSKEDLQSSADHIITRFNQVVELFKE